MQPIEVRKPIRIQLPTRQPRIIAVVAPGAEDPVAGVAALLDLERRDPLPDDLPPTVNLEQPPAAPSVTRKLPFESCDTPEMCAEKNCSLGTPGR